ncbi:MAG: TonB-dependent receptor [Magnetococcales bacterium]|nr:TonB-dependent receptor [Magnetococcales bacterium]
MNGFRIVSSLTLSLTLIAAFPATADQHSANEEIVVTASRYPHHESRTPAHITVINQKDIQDSPVENLPELLAVQAGIHISDINGTGRSHRVDLRGYGETASANVLVLVDGRRVNQADLSGTDWTQIPLARIRRIEIVRGGRGAVLYGDNAVGGVINILTEQGDKERKTVTFKGGSYGHVSAEAGLGDKRENFAYDLSAAGMRVTGHRENSSRESRDVGVSFSWYATDDLSVGLSAGYHWDETGLPGALLESNYAAGLTNKDTTHPDDFAETEDVFITLSPSWRFGSDNELKTDTSFRRREVTSFASGTWGSSAFTPVTDTWAVSPQLVLREPFFGLSNTLTLGADYQTDEMDVLNDSDFGGFLSVATYTLEKKNLGLYLQDTLILNDQWLVSAGYRHDQVDYAFGPGAGLTTDHDAQAWSLGVVYGWAKGSSAYANLSRSFRYPLLDELFSYATNTLDQTLKPQTANEYSVGVRHQFDQGLMVDLSLFQIITEDEIFYNAATFANTNLDGDSLREGITLSMVQKWQDFSVKAGYTWMKTEVRDGAFKGSEIPTVPQHQLSGGASWQLHDDLDVSLQGRYVGSRRYSGDFANTVKDQGSHFVADGRMRYKFKLLTATLDVKNLMNRDYSEYGALSWTGERAWYPSPGRRFFLSASLNF